MLTEIHCVNLPRSIVTDHYLLDQYGKVGRKAHAVGPANNRLKAQGRPNLASGISLYVTDDLQG